MAKKDWIKKTLKLKDDHTWTARPGFKIFVADRGAVRFDFPEDWVVIPTDDAIGFHDKKPPDDDCTLKLSVLRLPPEVDWSGLPLSRLVREIVDHDTRNVIDRQELVEVKRGDLEICWAEVRFIDPNECRVAHSRSCLARARNIQPLITFDYWADDTERCEPAWDEVLRSLRVGVMIKDPTRGGPGR